MIDLSVRFLWFVVYGRWIESDRAFGRSRGVHFLPCFSSFHGALCSKCYHPTSTSQVLLPLSDFHSFIFQHTVLISTLLNSNQFSIR